MSPDLGFQISDSRSQRDEHPLESELELLYTLSPARIIDSVSCSPAPGSFNPNPGSWHRCPLSWATTISIFRHHHHHHHHQSASKGNVNYSSGLHAIPTIFFSVFCCSWIKLFNIFWRPRRVFKSPRSARCLA